MGRPVAIMSLALLLSCGVESFKLSDKDYENFEKTVEFGAQVFLNWLDKVRDVTERFVKDHQLRTNRIAIQGHWNSFKDTANTISVEERVKGEQDDLVAAARTIRRLFFFYKDDVQNAIHSLATQKNIQEYLQPVNMFKGVIQKEQLHEVLGAVESQFFPGAPSIKNNPLEFLCYLLSTNTVETYMVNILKTGMDVISQIRSTDFQKLKQRLESALDEIRVKIQTFEVLEKQKEQDELLVSVKVGTRVCVFYWDNFLKYSASPEFMQKVHLAEKVFEDRDMFEQMTKMERIFLPVADTDLIIEAQGLHWDYFGDIYIAAINMALRPYSFINYERRWKTERAVSNIAIIVAAPFWKMLYEMEVFPAIDSLFYRAVNVSSIFVEDFETLRGIMQHWKPFKEEAYRVIEEERANTTVFLLPQVRACARLLSNYTNQLVNEYIDDSDTEQLAIKLENMRKICTEKLMARGIITQEQLDEAQRVFVEEMFKVLGVAGEHGMQESIRTLHKVSLAFLNIVYAPLIKTWNFISV
ncbi:uncharacterized protein [Hoplias malabaricus]|uniref:uncharacterized protein n=1 Tax=Hoplias malabaricus TaxID=27720 RepID=UPI0034622995